MRKIFITLVFAFVAVVLFAQQEPHYTNFMFNKLPLNPGYAGSKDVACFNALHRSQWLGWGEGAPTTQTVSFHTPLFSQRVGLGLGIVHDALGLTNQWRGNVAYAYRPKIGKGNLGIGIMGSIISHEYKGSEAVTTNPNDPIVSYLNNNKYVPNFGTGVYYNTDKFYAGISIPTLLKNSLDYSSTGVTTTTYTERRHMYLMAGALFDLSEKVQFKPALLVKYIGGNDENLMNGGIAAPFDADINAMFLFSKVFGLGATYRLGDSVDFLALYQAGQQFKLGVGYDLSLNELQDYSNGSIEIMAEYCLRNRTKKLLNPRFFF